MGTYYSIDYSHLCYSSLQCHDQEGSIVNLLVLWWLVLSIDQWCDPEPDWDGNLDLCGHLLCRYYLESSDLYYSIKWRSYSSLEKSVYEDHLPLHLLCCDDCMTLLLSIEDVALFGLYCSNDYSEGLFEESLFDYLLYSSSIVLSSLLMV